MDVPGALVNRDLRGGGSSILPEIFECPGVSRGLVWLLP